MTFQTSNDEILQLCSYITSDQSIAQYFGVSVERVAKVRAERPVSRGFERIPANLDNQPYSDRKKIDDGYDRMASERLCNAIWAFAEREAKRLRLNDAEHALWLLQDRPSIAIIQARAA